MRRRWIVMTVVVVGLDCLYVGKLKDNTRRRNHGDDMRGRIPLDALEGTG